MIIINGNEYIRRNAELDLLLGEKRPAVAVMGAESEETTIKNLFVTTTDLISKFQKQHTKIYEKELRALYKKLGQILEVK